MCVDPDLLGYTNWFFGKVEISGSESTSPSYRFGRVTDIHCTATFVLAYGNWRLGVLLIRERRRRAGSRIASRERILVQLPERMVRLYSVDGPCDCRAFSIMAKWKERVLGTNGLFDR